jgi:hypothetical protein
MCRLSDPVVRFAPILTMPTVARILFALSTRIEHTSLGGRIASVSGGPVHSASPSVAQPFAFNQAVDHIWIRKVHCVILVSLSDCFSAFGLPCCRALAWSLLATRQQKTGEIDAPHGRSSTPPRRAPILRLGKAIAHSRKHTNYVRSARARGTVKKQQIRAKLVVLVRG